MQDIYINSISDWYNFRDTAVGTSADPIALHLTADLDFKDEDIQPSTYKDYISSFDGDNYSIKNLSIIAPAGDAFFLGSTALNITNLKLENINIIANGYATPFIGQYATNVQVTGNIAAKTICCGVLMDNQGNSAPQCTQCSFSGILNATIAVGITTKNSESAYCEPTVNQCCVKATLAPAVNYYIPVRGFRGYQPATAIVNNSFSSLTILGDNTKNVFIGAPNIFYGQDTYDYVYIENINDISQVNIVVEGGNRKTITQNYVISNEASKINFTSSIVPILPLDDNLETYLRGQEWSI